ncbi:seed biotin-containing protein SBP65-like isoform X2 [Phalaenopsis equestris]|uniref:seed biotin-containing protein SBP65-like isoform X2 n=1 Tax=Phalaenopsis equestris TaxID=78828 RepID=UPI0009E2DDB9|nr:seed biotin-containing protein SBP65-like isoform X2 [Phalaenopsis equestris]
MASQQERTFNNVPSEEEDKQPQNHETPTNTTTTTTISPQGTVPYRAQAQQNSIDSINAAEERYAKAKESGSAAYQHTKDTVVHGVGAGTTYIAGKGYQAADYAVEKGLQGYEIAKDAAIAAAQKAAEVSKQAAVKAKEVTVSTGQSAMDYVKGSTGEVKETPLGGEGRTEEVGEAKVFRAAGEGCTAE